MRCGFADLARLPKGTRQTQEFGPLSFALWKGALVETPSEPGRFVADHGEAAICISASGYHRSRRSFCRKAARGKNGRRPHGDRVFAAGGFGATPPLPQGIKRLSLNEMAAFVAEDAGQVDPINVERRVWAPSRPVIHLAAAAVMLGQRLNKRGIPTGLETFLLDRGFVEEVSRKAEKLRALIASNAKFPVKAEQLVPFRLG
jgi:hypothetical protein